MWKTALNLWMDGVELWKTDTRRPRVHKLWIKISTARGRARSFFFRAREAHML